MLLDFMVDTKDIETNFFRKLKRETPAFIFLT